MQTAFTSPPTAFCAESPRAKVAGMAVGVLAVFVVLLACARFAPQWSQYWLVREPFGAIEMAHVALTLATFFIAVRLLFSPVVRSDWFLKLWLAALALGSLYIAGEEVSWGQWFWQWNTPEYWRGMNDQGETNLHNISGWFDQTPRAMLTIGIIISGIVFPWFLTYKPALVMRRFDLIYPPLWLLPVAVAVLFTDLFMHVDVPVLGQLVDRLRAGEVQELYIFWFLLGYAVALRRRILVLEGKA